MNIIDVDLKFNSNMQYGNVPNKLILHHAEASNCSVQDIHSWHLNNGWAGIGYHYFIRKDGSIYKGRADNVIGSHCQGSNTGSLGICFEGDYTKETMPVVQYNAGIELIKYLRNKFGNLIIYGHKELLATECPGSNFPLADFKILKQIEDTKKYYVVTNYLPKDEDGYLDISYALSFLNDTKCYLKSDSKGIWIETQYLTLEQCNCLKNSLGSWFYAIR